MYGLIRHCMSIYTRITEFITYKKPKIITVCITILSYLYVKYALLQACMFKNSLKQLCLYVYMDCTAIKHSRVCNTKISPALVRIVALKYISVPNSIMLQNKQSLI